MRPVNLLLSLIDPTKLFPAKQNHQYESSLGSAKSDILELVSLRSLTQAKTYGSLLTLAKTLVC